MRVFLVWKRRYADVRGGHTGTAPTVSFGWITRGWLVSFGQIARRRLVSFGWITYGTVDFVWGELRMDGILFVWDCVGKYDGDW